MLNLKINIKQAGFISLLSVFLAGCDFGSEVRNDVEVADESDSIVAIASLGNVQQIITQVRGRNDIFVDWTPVEDAEQYTVAIISLDDAVDDGGVDDAIACESDPVALSKGEMVTLNASQYTFEDVAGLTAFRVYVQAIVTNVQEEEDDGDGVVRSCVAFADTAETSLAAVQGLSAQGGVPANTELSNDIASEGVLFVTWEESEGADSYEIYIDESAPGDMDLSTPSELVRIHQADGPNFAVPNSGGVSNPILNSTAYDIVVVAIREEVVDIGGTLMVVEDRVVSDEVTVTSLPLPPANVQVQAGVEFVNVQWDDSATDANYFTVYISGGAEPIDILDEATFDVSFTIEGGTEINISSNALVNLNLEDVFTFNLEPSVSYQVVVSASNVEGQEGRLSATSPVVGQTVGIGQQALNDTGVFRCADYSFLTEDLTYIPTGTHSSELLACDESSDDDLVPETRQQDAENGRDNLAATGQIVTDGGLGQESGEKNGVGFLFTRVSELGTILLADDINNTQCILDLTTGLLWLSKSESGSSDFFDASFSYSWFESNSDANGGGAGLEGSAGTTCGIGSEGISSNKCNTSSYVAGANEIKRNLGDVDNTMINVCNATWRLPTVNELLSIVHYGGDVNNTNSTDGERLINTYYFPNTRAGAYWTSSPSASDPSLAKVVDFSTGEVYESPKTSSHLVRLVSDETL